MSSAQREIQPVDEASVETEAYEPFALKQQIAEKVAAHRARRTQSTGPQLTTAAASGSAAKARSARIAAAVAERYAQSQSYRAFLAEEAEKAIRQAEAAAEVARRSAEAVVAAQYELLAELDQNTAEPAAPTFVHDPVKTPASAGAAPVAPKAPAPEAAVPSVGLRVQLFEDVSLSSPQPVVAARAGQAPFIDDDERMALDEEIAFRQSPVFEETVPPVEIPANLIEFPRQLVAARRARPRLAEGPLRDEADHAPDASQLRIFEVEATQISTAPVVESAAPEWSSILLSAQPEPVMVQAALEEQYNPAMVPQTAPLSLRLMAGIVDGVLVTATELIFIAVFALTANHFSQPGTLQLTPQAAAIAAMGTLAILGLLYQLLFFTFSEATPGMRYARIGLCTFSDDNPTRAAMRRRIFVHLLSACPLGMGYLWALLDDDRLGWHDRATRMYQRSY
ncbi:RDD family protein [Edaphobacter bradus]|uniref:RDD family protein n=1 Tax=Edaphobacter bradus TaxID=2259016 RepID=UPI0021DF5A46|nr:RDD family protein [Edaphobacter bradus]